MKAKTSARAVARSGQMRVPISSLSRAQNSLRQRYRSMIRCARSFAGAPTHLISRRNSVRRVFAAAIDCAYAAGLQVRPAVGHLQRVDDELGAVVVGHRVADDLAGGQVQPAGEVEPALGGRAGR